MSQDDRKSEMLMARGPSPQVMLPDRYPGQMVVGTLDWIASAAYGGRDQMMELAWSLVSAQGRDADQRWRDFINLWLLWEDRRVEGVIEAHEVPTLNQIAVALKLPVAEFVEWLATGIGEMTRLVARHRLAIETDGVVEAAVAYAKMPDGHQDRKMLLQATGIVPSGGGGVNVSVNQQVGVKVDARTQSEMKVPLLKFSETTEAIDEAVRGAVDGEIVEEP